MAGRRARWGGQGGRATPWVVDHKTDKTDGRSARTIAISGFLVRSEEQFAGIAESSNKQAQRRAQEQPALLRLYVHTAAHTAGHGTGQTQGVGLLSLDSCRSARTTVRRTSVGGEAGQYATGEHMAAKAVFVRLLCS